MLGQVIKKFLVPGGNHGSLLHQNVLSTHPLLRYRIQSMTSIHFFTPLLNIDLSVRRLLLKSFLQPKCYVQARSLPCVPHTSPISSNWIRKKYFYFIIIIIIHGISVMELGHLLTRSGLTYPEVPSKVCHDSFCQLENSVSLPWVIYYKAFYLHVASSFSCTPVICPKFVLFLIPFNLCICFVICPSVSCCSSHIFHFCCCYSSGVPWLNSPSFAAI